MENLPPKAEQIVIMKEREPKENKMRHIGSVVVQKYLWEEMEEQMQHAHMNLNEFVNLALSSYVNDLLEKEEMDEKYAAFSDLQVFTSQPIDIGLRPEWNEKKGE